jgi:hypothetical protein
MFDGISPTFAIAAIVFAASMFSSSAIAQGDVFGANSTPTTCREAQFREAQIYRQNVAAIQRIQDPHERLREDQDEQTRHKKALVDIDVMCFVPAMDPASRCAVETAAEAKLARQIMGALQKRQLDVQNQNWHDRWACNGDGACITAADRNAADEINRISKAMSDENARHQKALTHIRNGSCAAADGPENIYPQVRHRRPQPMIPTIAPAARPPYILAGTYDVYQGAWNSGDSPAGSAQVVPAGPGTFRIIMKSGQAMIQDIGPGKDGTRIFAVKGGDQKLAFHRLPAYSSLVTYDVWWIGAGKNGQNVVETWVLR